MTEAEIFWTHKDGDTSGPFSLDEIRSEVENPKYLHSDLVHNIEFGGWISIGAFKARLEEAQSNLYVPIETSADEDPAVTSDSAAIPLTSSITASNQDLELATRQENSSDEKAVIEQESPIEIESGPSLAAQNDPGIVELKDGERFYKATLQQYLDDKDLAILRMIDEDSGKSKKVLARISCFDKKSPLLRNESVLIQFRDDEGQLRATKVLRNQKHAGSVATWKDERGFGFITHDDGTEIFAHYSEIKAAGPRFLIEGEEVHYSVVEKDGRLSAKNIQPLQSRFAIERFANMDKFTSGELILRLADMAIPEDWNFRKSSQSKLPVLHGYIYYTFDRLFAEKKVSIEFKEGRRISCFNTGLVTTQYEPIYGYFEENRERKRFGASQTWMLANFLTSSDRRLSSVGDLPDIANYFSDPSGLIYDANRDLRMDFDHIIEDNNNRFPQHLRENRHKLRNALVGAREIAIQRVKRNYKTAIPQYYKGKLQLLLPLCLENPNNAELALVVAKDGEVYIGSTILNLEDAYNNARLIACPDREWLQP